MWMVLFWEFLHAVREWAGLGQGRLKIQKEKNLKMWLSAVPNSRNSKTENFLFPQTPTLKKKTKTESFESKTAFGFDFLETKEFCKVGVGVNFFKKNLGARHQKNVEKIFMFWTQTSSKFAGGKRGGAKTFFKSFLGKKFELRSIKIPNKNSELLSRSFCLVDYY